MTITKPSLLYQVQGYYLGTKAAIEALTGVPEGSIGYATDTNEFGSFDGSAWTWGQGAALTQAQVEDIVGAMVSGNTETGIGVTYDSGARKINFVAEVTQSEVDDVQNALDAHTGDTNNPHAVTTSQIGAINQTGWFPNGSTWSYVSADAPNFVIKAEGVDLTNIISVYAKLRLTQTTTKYFFIVKVELSGSDTLFTLYGGTDYTLANAAVSNVEWSVVKAPLGFPLDEDKWSVTITSTSNHDIASPTANTWYGGSGLSPTGPSVDIPIGAWHVRKSCDAHCSLTTVALTSVSVRTTLSTANNSESDNDFHSITLVTFPIGSDQMHSSHWKEKTLILTAKTTYYLNILTGISGVTTLRLAGAVEKTILRATFAFL